MKLTAQDQDTLIEMYFDACQVKHRRDMTAAQYKVRRQKRHELFRKLLTTKELYESSSAVSDGVPAQETAN